MTEQNNKPVIEILDCCCGSGKTTKLIDDISKLNNDTKVIYVTPLLSECYRVSGAYPKETEDGDVDYSQPEIQEFGGYIYDTSHKLYSKFFQHPTASNKDGSKLTGLTSLLEQGHNITTTHALFRSLTKEHLDLIKSQNYLLVIDEVLSVYTEYLELKNELPKLLENKIMFLDTDGVTLRWNRTLCCDLERYETEINLCDSGSLLLLDNKVLLWEMSPEILSCFKQIKMATYLFDGSYMCGFLKYHGFTYTTETFGKKGKDFKSLIQIVNDDKLNKIGDRITALSSSSQVNNRTYNDQLKKNLVNLFNHKHKVPKEERLWCCYKGAFNSIKGFGYTKNFLAVGTKATNNYAHTSVVAFTVNLFANPIIARHLQTKGITIDENKLALGEMIQWLYRSRIRKNESIVAYIPSRRMRELLIDWLNGKYD
jgi:hypothetical protein